MGIAAVLLLAISLIVNPFQGTNNQTSGKAIGNLSMTPGSNPFGVHPSMAGLQSLFESGNAAVVANVGPLNLPVVALCAGGCGAVALLSLRNARASYSRGGLPRCLRSREGVDFLRPL